MDEVQRQEERVSSVLCVGEGGSKMKLKPTAWDFHGSSAGQELPMARDLPMVDLYVHTMIVLLFHM